MFIIYIWIIMLVVAAYFGLSWVERTNWGRNALDDAPVRENSLGLWVPLLLFGTWIITAGIFKWIIDAVSGTAGQEIPTVQYVSVAASSIVTSFLALNLAVVFFTGGLKGFGLDFRNILQDIKHAALTLLMVWPFVSIVMAVMSYLVPLLTGDKMEMPTHPLIDYAQTSGSPWVIALAFVLAVVIAPILEEIIFRGIVQTKLSDNLQSRWGAIFMTSAFFAMVHGGTLWMHWPGLFVFSIALGYTYEKSGSLLRSMFLHSFFNLTSLVISLLTVAQ